MAEAGLSGRQDMADAWCYRSDPSDRGLEYGVWAGSSAPAVASHFHDEAQLTLVLSGSRLFDVAGRRFGVPAGACLFIPARLPHRSLPHHHTGTRCLNLYFSRSTVEDVPVILDVPRICAQAEQEVPVVVLLRLLPYLPAPMPAPQPLAMAELADTLRIGALASGQGLSREGFSRRFSRGVGMPPHAYRLAARLNEARRQLRAGQAIAAVAADTGFADQSHLGRHFRRLFGVTPGTYRAAMR